MGASEKLSQASALINNAAILAREAAAELLADITHKPETGRDLVNLHLQLRQVSGEVAQRSKDLTPAPLPVPLTAPEARE